jgi:hypothetical protein
VREGAARAIADLSCYNRKAPSDDLSSLKWHDFEYAREEMLEISMWNKHLLVAP